MKASYSRQVDQRVRTVEQKRAARRGERVNPRPWVAEITGLDPVHGFARTFVNGLVDIVDGRGREVAGLYMHWLLESGRYYEAQHNEGTRTVRQFLTVSDTGIVEWVSREEVYAWASTI